MSVSLRLSKVVGGGSSPNTMKYNVGGARGASYTNGGLLVCRPVEGYLDRGGAREMSRMVGAARCARASKVRDAVEVDKRERGRSQE